MLSQNHIRIGGISHKYETNSQKRSWMSDTSVLKESGLPMIDVR